MASRERPPIDARRSRPTAFAALALGALLLAVGAARSSTDQRDSASGAASGPPSVGVGIGFDRRVDEPPAPAALANLDPALLDALRRATKAAVRDGIRLQVNSGWRSAEQQERLLREAIDEYGSAREAARWVATPETSAHVSGDAIDIGPRSAAAWLAEHGSRYGLCQIYENEPWHFELRPRAVEHGCPARYANPTHDPRMQR